MVRFLPDFHPMVFKTAVLVAVIVPLLATMLAIYLLWERAVSWSDLVLLVIPLVIGGWTGFLWGGLVRIFLVHHATFSVNSVCHTFGKREYETKDQSRNEWIVGLLTFGEGWHNNHHAFPRSAFHGLHWWQFDLSGYIIRALERLGLAEDVYRIPPALPERYALNKEGSTPNPLEELV